MLNDVCLLMESGDSFQAMALIEKQGTPAEVGRWYADLVSDLYYKKRDVPRMVFIGRAGIQYCLAESVRLSGDEEEAARMKGLAKVIAYKLSVNTWPGWEEPGIVVNDSDGIAGLDAARLNLRLAVELNRDENGLGNAYWVLGAQYLVFGKTELAVEEFIRAVEQFQRGDLEEFEQMARGYIGIAKMTEERMWEDGKQTFSDAIAALKGMGTEDATFFVEQLKSVSAYFGKLKIGS